MKYTYTITEQDFIDYNLQFVATDKVIQNALKRMRLLMASIVLVGGFGLLYAIKGLSVLSVLVYVGLAVGVYCYIPRFYQSQVKKSVRRTLQNARNKELCGEKILTMTEETVNLTGKNEDTTYSWGDFKKVVVGEKQIYLHLDDVTALIVPHHAFASTAARDAFVTDFEQRIAQAQATSSQDENA